MIKNNRLKPAATCPFASFRKQLACRLVVAQRKLARYQRLAEEKGLLANKARGVMALSWFLTTIFWLDFDVIYSLQMLMCRVKKDWWLKNHCHTANNVFSQFCASKSQATVDRTMLTSWDNDTSNQSWSSGSEKCARVGTRGQAVMLDKFGFGVLDCFGESAADHAYCILLYTNYMVRICYAAKRFVIISFAFIYFTRICNLNPQHVFWTRFDESTCPSQSFFVMVISVESLAINQDALKQAEWVAAKKKDAWPDRTPCGFCNILYVSVMFWLISNMG